MSLLLTFTFTPTSPPLLSTLSLHDALPISFSSPGGPSGISRTGGQAGCAGRQHRGSCRGHTDHQLRSQGLGVPPGVRRDRKSTRLNSSHVAISYAVFCLKKKNKKQGGE